MFIKYYIYAAILAAVLGFGWWVKHLSDTVDKQKATISQKVAENLALEQEKKQLIFAVQKASQNSVVYQKQDEVIKNEKSTLNSDLNSGRKLVYVRASCPSSPATSPSASGTTNATARLDPAAQPDYANLIAAIKSNANKFNLCMADNALLRQEIEAFK